ncbi:MAG TPA: branched-chain amino acid ABC transporter substrate-binding protein [Patescibacteria group bacterium]|nr:branched-chain amino acid ABC transporter substrate-binding protein [Patescibacteria group bacterium]
MHAAGDDAKMKRTWIMVSGAAVVVLAIVSGLVLMSWQNSHKKSATVTHRVVKIGLMAPLTGDVASYGAILQHGVELAQHDFNTPEGLSFQVLVRDTQCDGTKATAAIKEFSQAGVLATIGDTCSGSTLAALPTANELHMLIVSPSASSPKLAIPNDYFYRTYPMDSQQAIYATQLMYQGGARKASLFYTDEAYGQGLNTVASVNFKKLGGTVVSSTPFKAGTLDFKDAMTTAAAAKPDVIYIMSNSIESASAIVLQAKQLGVTAKLYGSDALRDDSFASDVGTSGEGMTVLGVTFGSQAFVDEYKAAYGAAPTGATGAQAYDAFTLIANIVKSGATTSDQIRAQLAKVDFQGVSGRIRFDANGDISDGGYNIFKIQSGKFVESSN